MKRALAPFVLVAIAVGALLLGAGGSAAATQQLAVTLDEGVLAASASTVRSGALQIDTTNAGAADHEILIVRTELPADRLGDPRFAGIYVLGQPHAHFEEAAGLKSRHIRPGGSRRDVVDLAPGNYVLFCGLPGHYESGQRAALRVTR